MEGRWRRASDNAEQVRVCVSLGMGPVVRGEVGCRRRMSKRNGS